MATSNAQMNVGPVTWTPAGGSLITLTRVKGATLDKGIKMIMDAADFDVYDTIAVVGQISPKITLELLDAFQFANVVGGQRGTLVIPFRDIANGIASGGGGWKITVVNAFLETDTAKHGHRQLATNSVGFSTVSTDGSTSPITVAAY